MKNNRLWVLGAPDPEMDAIEDFLRAHSHADFLRWRDTVVYATADGKRVHPGNAYRAELSPEIDAVRTSGGHIILVECDLESPVLGTGGRNSEIDCAAKVTVVDHHRPGDPGYGRPPAEFMQASSIGQVISIMFRNTNIDTQWVGLGWYLQDGGGRYGWAIIEPDGIKISDDEPDWGAQVTDVLRESGAPDTHGFGQIAMGANRRWWVGSGYGDETGGSEEYWYQIPSDLVLIAAADHCLDAAYRGECPGVDPDALMKWMVEQQAQFQ